MCCMLKLWHPINNIELDNYQKNIKLDQNCPGWNYERSAHKIKIQQASKSKDILAQSLGKSTWNKGKIQMSKLICKGQSSPLISLPQLFNFSSTSCRTCPNIQWHNFSPRWHLGRQPQQFVWNKSTSFKSLLFSRKKSKSQPHNNPVVSPIKTTGERVHSQSNVDWVQKYIYMQHTTPEDKASDKQPINISE